MHRSRLGQDKKTERASGFVLTTFKTVRLRSSWSTGSRGSISAMDSSAASQPSQHTASASRHRNDSKLCFTAKLSQLICSVKRNCALQLPVCVDCVLPRPEPSCPDPACAAIASCRLPTANVNGSSTRCDACSQQGAHAVNSSTNC